MIKFKTHTLVIFVMANFILQCERIATEALKKEVYNKDYFMEIADRDSVYLRWDKPANTTRAVSGYKILYRPHNNGYWTLLNKPIPSSDSPFVCIYRSEVVSTGDMFDFAVRAYFQDGDSSNISSSTDSTAAAYKGWFIKWQ